MPDLIIELPAVGQSPARAGRRGALSDRRRASSVGITLSLALVVGCGSGSHNTSADAAAGASAGGATGTTGGATGTTGGTSSGGSATGGGTATGGSATGGAGGTGAQTAAKFPLKQSANKRYLVDQNDKPFLIAGDAPQALTVNVSESDAELFFANRESHGFNAAWVNLLCATYTAGRADATTYDGIKPFTTPGDLSTPNEQFFTRVDHMLESAAKHGIVVFLDPAETGSFLSVMSSNGASKCRDYGRYLGNRYKSFDNIVWMSGNDYQDWSNAANDAVVTAVAQGIKDNDTRHIHTVELDYLVSSSTNDANWVPIIGLNAAYTYYPTYAEVLKDYNRTPVMPVFLVEAVYEFESNAQAQTSSPHTLRRQEYWTNLSGATGQLYGNHYTWTFVDGWKDHLDSPGSVQMAYVKKLLEPLRWYDLVPDQKHTLVTAGYGTFSSTAHVDDSDYLTAAMTADGTLALAYMPTSRTITVDLSKLHGQVTARWYDPSGGTFTSITGSPFPKSGTHDFAPPGKNAGGDDDWVLVLDAP